MLNPPVHGHTGPTPLWQRHRPTLAGPQRPRGATSQIRDHRHPLPHSRSATHQWCRVQWEPDRGKPAVRLQPDFRLNGEVPIVGIPELPSALWAGLALSTPVRVMAPGVKAPGARHHHGYWRMTAGARLAAAVGPVTTTPRLVARRRVPPLIASPPLGTYMASSKVVPVGALATAIVGQALPPAGTEVEM
jgi:hypothetical protein